MKLAGGHVPESVIKEKIAADAILLRWRRLTAKLADRKWPDWTENERLEMISIVREMRPWLTESGTWKSVADEFETYGVKL